jgi:hypothetical protein
MATRKQLAAAPDVSGLGRFLDALQSAGDLTREGAHDAFLYFQKHKLFSVDSLGQYRPRDGGYMDRSAVRRAAQLGASIGRSGTRSVGSAGLRSARKLPSGAIVDYAERTERLVRHVGKTRIYVWEVSVRVVTPELPTARQQRTGRVQGATAEEAVETMRAQVAKQGWTFVDVISVVKAMRSPVGRRVGPTRGRSRSVGRAKPALAVWAVYGGKAYSMDYVPDPKRRFSFAGMRVSDNAGGGYVVEGEKVYAIRRSSRKATPVTGDERATVLSIVGIQSPRGVGRARPKGPRIVDFGGYELRLDDPHMVRRETIDTRAPGDYGADPIGDGMFRMVPSGDIVDFAERNRRLERFRRHVGPRRAKVDPRRAPLVAEHTARWPAEEIATHLRQPKKRARKWSAKVTKGAKYHPPPGLFTQPAHVIADVLQRDSETVKQAIARVTFYQNRAGKNLSSAR